MQELLAGVGVATLAAAGWFGNFMGNFKPVDTGRAPSTVAATTSRAMQEKRMDAGKKPDARAGTKANIACVASAVATREDALADGSEVLGDAMTAAYEARGDALAAAYAKTGDETVRASMKSAWEGFKTSGKTARDTWNATQRSAWKAFEASVKACGGSTVSDSANASADAVQAPVI